MIRGHRTMGDFARKDEANQGWGPPRLESASRGWVGLYYTYTLAIRASFLAKK